MDEKTMSETEQKNTPLNIVFQVREIENGFVLSIQREHEYPGQEIYFEFLEQVKEKISQSF